MVLYIPYKKRILRSIRRSEQYLQAILQIRSERNQALNPVFSLSDQLHQYHGVYSRQILLDLRHFERFLEHQMRATRTHKHLALFDYYRYPQPTDAKERSRMKWFSKRKQTPDTETLIMASMERIETLETTIQRLFQQAKKSTDKQSIAYRALSAQYASAKKELASELNIVERLIASKEQAVTHDILKRRNHMVGLLDTLAPVSFEEAEELWDQIQAKELAFDSKQEHFHELDDQLQQTPFHANEDPLSRDLENDLLATSGDDSGNPSASVESHKTR